MAITQPLTGVEAEDDGFASFFAGSYGDLVQAVALTVGDAELAADAVAEAMVKAHLRWKRLAGSSNPAGWVYRVAVNWARRKRSRRWREVTTAEPPDRATLPVFGADPTLARALADLPLEQRTVVVLRHALDWSEADTAAALDIAPGTVKSRLSRGAGRPGRGARGNHGNERRSEGGRR